MSYPKAPLPADPPAGQEVRLITRRQLQALLPLSAMSIWRMEKDGRLPRHVKLGNRNYWKFAEVVAALDRLGQAPSE